MAYRFVVKKISDDKEEMVRFLHEDLFPLYYEYWELYGKKLYGKPIDFDVISLLQMWVAGSLFIIMAYDGEEAVGFLIGFKTRPYTHQEFVLHLERWFGKSDEVMHGLGEYLNRALKIMDATEIYIPQYDKMIPGFPQITVPEPLFMEFSIKRHKLG